MEKEALIRGLAFLEEKAITIGAFVTDRHPGIRAYLRDHCPGIQHYFDIWHVAKGTVISFSQIFCLFVAVLVPVLLRLGQYILLSVILV
ncbi:hypothetical protein HPB48_011561 [Haemaphysalis longicornis]|uniref:Uncharacterized protein n=1 Tax=Haemaphysalis longicornis TaxID=44386 RepID=A0A9J6G0K5_HAELO|nr:hypothetical protein HPB48_011561 [Haemaphysalis longicornis]